MAAASPTSAPSHSPAAAENAPPAEKKPDIRAATDRAADAGRDLHAHSNSRVHQQPLGNRLRFRPCPSLRAGPTATKYKPLSES